MTETALAWAFVAVAGASIAFQAGLVVVAVLGRRRERRLLAAAFSDDLGSAS